MKSLLTILIIALLLSTITLAIPPLPAPRGAGTAVVYNDQIYFFGGSNNWSGTTCYQDVFRYNSTTWDTIVTQIPDDDTWAMNAVLVGDTVYLLSGWNNSEERIRRYHIVSNSWDTIPLPNNLNTQSWGTTAQYDNRVIYLFNGYRDVYKFNVDLATWTLGTTYPDSTVTDGYLCSFLINHEIYVLGYENSSFGKYNTLNDTWTLLAPPTINDTLISLQAACMGESQGELVVAAAISDGGSFNGTYDPYVYVYNPQTNSWRRDYGTIVARAWAAGVMYQGGFYVMGGLVGTTQNTALDSVIQITLEGTSQLTEQSNLVPNEFDLSVYPNPFNSTTYLNVNLSENAELIIYNIQGQIVRNFNVKSGHQKISLNANDMPSGIYLIRLSTMKQSLTRKVVLLK